MIKIKSEDKLSDEEVIEENVKKYREFLKKKGIVVDIKGRKEIFFQDPPFAEFDALLQKKPENSYEALYQINHHLKRIYELLYLKFFKKD